MTVGDAADGSPGGFVFGPADGPEGPSCGRETVSDLPQLAKRGVNQDEPEVWLIGMQSDAAGSPVRIVVWVRENAGKGPVARHTRSIGSGTDMRNCLVCHLTSDRRTRRSPIAIGISSQTTPVTPSCAHWSPVSDPSNANRAPCA